MKHKWQELSRITGNPERRRRCTNCGAEQEYITRKDWGRVAGMEWKPNAGRCGTKNIWGRGLK